MGREKAPRRPSPRFMERQMLNLNIAPKAVAAAASGLSASAHSPGADQVTTPNRTPHLTLAATQSARPLLFPLPHFWINNLPSRSSSSPSERPPERSVGSAHRPIGVCAASQRYFGRGSKLARPIPATSGQDFRCCSAAGDRPKADAFETHQDGERASDCTQRTYLPAADRPSFKGHLQSRARRRRLQSSLFPSSCPHSPNVYVSAAAARRPSLAPGGV